MISVEGLTPPSLSSLPGLTFVCGHDLPVLDTRETKPIPAFEIEPIWPFWTRRRQPIPGFQMEQIYRFWTHGEKADSRIRNRIGFEPCYKTQFGGRGNLNYAADGISNLAHRPTTLFPTSSSSRIFVGEVGNPRASQSVSRAVQAFSVFKHFQERKKRKKGWLNYHHRKQRKGKKACLVRARLCHTSVAKERSF